MTQLHDYGYVETAISNIHEVCEKQAENIQKAAALMADAIENDRLINVYGGGGHTTLVMGEMFFRAGGLCNINPIMETGLSVFNQALKYLELERCVNYGSAIMKYYGLQPGDVLLIFHNIGINAATIDAALEAKKRPGQKSWPFPVPTGRRPCPPTTSSATPPARIFLTWPTSALTTTTP